MPANSRTSSTRNEAPSEKTAGFDRNTAPVEQPHAAWTACGRMREHGVSGKDRGKHHDVAQEEYPEAVANHDPLRSGTGLTCTRHCLVTNLIIHCNSDVHTAISAGFVRSNRAICSVGILISSSLRNAK